MKKNLEQANNKKFSSLEKLIVRDPVDTNSLKRIIRELGVKVTQQRLAILQCLASGKVHVTAHEVYEALQYDYPDMGFATVYRFLKKMSQKNYVTEVRMGGLPARYELTPRTHHDHLSCEICGKIVEFENPEIEALQVQVASNHGFKLTHHVLELYGICQSCKDE